MANLACRSGPLDEFVARPVPRRVVPLALGALLATFGGLWMTGILGQAPSAQYYPDEVRITIGWVATLFFAICFIKLFSQFLNKEPIIIINAQGIVASQWSDDTIPWSEITNVSTWSYRGTSAIILHLRDARLYPARGLQGWLAWTNRLLTGGDIALGLNSTDKTVEEALAVIHAHRARFTRIKSVF